MCDVGSLDAPHVLLAHVLVHADTVRVIRSHDTACLALHGDRRSPGLVDILAGHLPDISFTVRGGGLQFQPTACSGFD